MTTEELKKRLEQIKSSYEASIAQTSNGCECGGDSYIYPIMCPFCKHLEEARTHYNDLLKQVNESPWENAI